jgi:hypothetical protein
LSAKAGLRAKEIARLTWWMTNDSQGGMREAQSSPVHFFAKPVGKLLCRFTDKTIPPARLHIPENQCQRCEPSAKVIGSLPTPNLQHHTNVFAVAFKDHTGWLNCVTANQSRYPWQQISAKGWRLREPAELDFAMEVPSVLPSIVKAHLTDLGYSMDELTKLVRIYESEFVEMYGVKGTTPPSKAKLQIIR